MQKCPTGKPVLELDAVSVFSHNFTFQGIKISMEDDGLSFLGLYRVFYRQQFFLSLMNLEMLPSACRHHFPILLIARGKLNMELIH
jgi:hypothetical protein